MSSVTASPSVPFRQHFSRPPPHHRPQYDTRVVVQRGRGFRPVRPPRFVNLMEQQRQHLAPPAGREQPPPAEPVGRRPSVGDSEEDDGQWKEVRSRNWPRRDEVKTTFYRKSDSHNYEMQQRAAAQYNGRRSHDDQMYRGGLSKPPTRHGSTSSNDDPSIQLRPNHPPRRQGSNSSTPPRLQGSTSSPPPRRHGSTSSNEDLSPNGSRRHQRRSPNHTPRVEFDFTSLPQQYSRDKPEGPDTTARQSEDLRQEIERRKQLRRTEEGLKQLRAEVEERDFLKETRVHLRKEVEEEALVVQPDVLSWLKKEWRLVSKQLSESDLSWPHTVKYYR